jgi:hypothetical protein
MLPAQLPVMFGDSEPQAHHHRIFLKSDVTGDCLVDMRDFASLASEWLQCGNPFDPNCVQ